MSPNKIRHERIRPVAFEVDESGSVVFVEHVRVESRRAAFAPRLHFYDDTSGKTGKLIAGYVSPAELGAGLDELRGRFDVQSLGSGRSPSALVRVIEPSAVRARPGGVA